MKNTTLLIAFALLATSSALSAMLDVFIEAPSSNAAQIAPKRPLLPTISPFYPVLKKRRTEIIRPMHILDVAQFVLNKLRARFASEDSELIMKRLEEILYYAQGCALALYDEKLFEDSIVKQENGITVRTVRALYDTHRQGIDQTKKGILPDPSFVSNFDEKKLDERYQTLLNCVLQVFQSTDSDRETPRKFGPPP